MTVVRPKSDMASGRPGTATPPQIPQKLEKLRDIPFPAGVDLEFLVKELARDLELNVLVSMENVTSRVQGAVKPGMTEKQALDARKAEQRRIADETENRGLGAEGALRLRHISDPKGPILSERSQRPARKGLQRPA